VGKVLGIIMKTPAIETVALDSWEKVHPNVRCSYKKEAFWFAMERRWNDEHTIWVPAYLIQMVKGGKIDRWAWDVESCDWKLV
jgi:hypothetical protein